MPYNKQYLVATSTSRKAYICTFRDTYSPKMMSIWTLYKYFLRLSMDFPFGGFSIVAKDPIVEGRRTELTRLEFVAEVRWV